ncbi:MAG: hypothetical protein J6Y08_03795 [Clostridiales bacterium]|nr:hypothetical protein [Clostridiales bacterium]
MQKQRIISFLLVLVMLLSLTSCKKKSLTQTSSVSAKRHMEIVYKRGQTCYAIDPESDEPSLYVFSLAGQPVFDQDDSPVSSTTLVPGMLVEVSYDGYILDSYPSQFSGINKIAVRERRANNVDFLVAQISGMFPSTKPDENNLWEIAFGGTTYLTHVEQKALEYILRENWTGATVTVEPQEEKAFGSGSIQVNFMDIQDDTMELEIIVDDGSGENLPETKRIIASCATGSWVITEYERI